MRDAVSGKWIIESVRSDGAKNYSFLDMFRGVYMARRKSALQLDGRIIPPESSAEYWHLKARFRANRSFTLAFFESRPIDVSNNIDAVYTEVVIEPDSIFTISHDSPAAPFGGVRFLYRKGFNPNQFYDIKIIGKRDRSFLNVFVNGELLTELQYGSAGLSVGDGYYNRNTGLPSSNSPFYVQSVGITSDDSTLLYLDYVKLGFGSLTTVAWLYDLTFPNVMGTFAESLENVIGTRVNSEDMKVRAVKYYPNADILKEENIAAGLPSNARTYSNNGWVRLSHSSPETPIVDPFGDVMVLNRSFLEE